MTENPAINPITASAAAAAAAFVVLGIPLAALAAALLGAGFSNMPKPAEKLENVPLRLLGILMDAFLGGWVAVFLVNIPYTRAFIGEWDSAVVVLAGLLAFLMQTIRGKAGGYFDRAFQGVLNAWVGFFSKGKGAE